MAAIFQNGRPEYILFNISASPLHRIVILVSKHTYLGARIPTELIANTYLPEIGSHFPKWRLKYNFVNISASINWVQELNQISHSGNQCTLLVPDSTSVDESKNPGTQIFTAL